MKVPAQFVADPLARSSDEQVSFSQEEVVLGDQRVLIATHRSDPQSSRDFEFGHGHTVCSLSQAHVDDFDFAGLEGQMKVELLLNDLFVHHTRNEARRRNVVDVEFLIGRLPERVVEAGNRRRDHKDLLRELYRHQVGVVRIGDCDECVRVFDAGFSQRLHVVREAVVDRPVECRAEQLKRCLVHVDDGHVMAFDRERVGEVSSYTAAPCNHDSHIGAMIGCPTPRRVPRDDDTGTIAEIP